jgi:hypothetical protein
MDRPDTDAGANQGDGNRHRSGQQHLLKPLGAYGPTGIIDRDGVRCPLRLHDAVKSARQPPHNDGGGRPAA